MSALLIGVGIAAVVAIGGFAIAAMRAGPARAERGRTRDDGDTSVLYTSNFSDSDGGARATGEACDTDLSSGGDAGCDGGGDDGGGGGGD